MKVNLVSYTQSAPALAEHNISTIEDLVAYCARVSNPSNQLNTETSDKLIKYLLKHKHFSPFEMVNVCLEIETTRDIARQILRHRSFTFQEFSQRYADPVKDLEFVMRELRFQDPNNRQNSVEAGGTLKDELLKDDWKMMQQAVINMSKAAYKWAVEHGIAKEVARCVLPEGNTMSRMYVNGTLRSWIHYIDVRSANGTQKEHMEVAKACASVIATLFPGVENANV